MAEECNCSQEHDKAESLVEEKPQEEKKAEAPAPAATYAAQAPSPAARKILDEKDTIFCKILEEKNKCKQADKV